MTMYFKEEKHTHKSRLAEKALEEWNDSKWFIALVFTSLLALVRFAYVG